MIRFSIPTFRNNIDNPMRILLNKFVKRVSLTRTTTDLTCPASTLSSVSARHYTLKRSIIYIHYRLVFRCTNFSLQSIHLILHLYIVLTFTWRGECGRTACMKGRPNMQRSPLMAATTRRSQLYAFPLINLLSGESTIAALKRIA